MLVFVTGLWFESTCNKRRHSQQNQTTTTPPRHAIFSVHHRHCRFSSTAPSPKPLWLLRRYLQLQKKKKKKKIRVTPHSDYLTIFFFFFNSEYIYRHRHAGLKEKDAKVFWRSWKLNFRSETSGQFFPFSDLLELLFYTIQ